MEIGSLRDECIAALLRSDGALRAYNEVGAILQSHPGSPANVSKALLYPGRVSSPCWSRELRLEAPGPIEARWQRPQM